MRNCPLDKLQRKHPKWFIKHTHILNNPRWWWAEYKEDLGNGYFAPVSVFAITLKELDKKISRLTKQFV